MRRASKRRHTSEIARPALKPLLRKLLQLEGKLDWLRSQKLSSTLHYPANVCTVNHGKNLGLLFLTYNKKIRSPRIDKPLIVSKQHSRYSVGSTMYYVRILEHQIT